MAGQRRVTACVVATANLGHAPRGTTFTELRRRASGCASSLRCHATQSSDNRNGGCADRPCSVGGAPHGAGGTPAGHSMPVGRLSRKLRGSDGLSAKGQENNVTVLSALWAAVYTGAGLFWRALWALALGYAISAVIQVFVSRPEAAKRLGSGSPPQLGLAMLLGFASSSCSFAALSATRSLFTKGAALTSALAFMFASTNLAVEVAALAFIFLGWQYVVALFVGAPILVAVMALLVRLTKLDHLTEAAREHAEHASGMEMNPSEGLPGSLRQRAKDYRAWHRVGSAYVAEWAMVWKELLVGFLVAGAVAALVPASFFQALFPGEEGAWWTIPAQAVLAPVLAVLTFIGSMGNGPLAAILASHGVVFAAIMTFLYADFVVPPALKINANYYGWRFAGYLAAVFTVSAVIAGVVVHLLFALVGWLPRGGGRNVAEMATFALDYTFWLNLVAIIVGVTLAVLARRKPAQEGEKRTGQRVQGAGSP